MTVRRGMVLFIGGSFCRAAGIRFDAHVAFFAHHAHAVADLELIRLARLHHVGALAFLAIQLDPDLEAGFGGDAGLLAERAAEHPAEYHADRCAAPAAGVGAADLAEDAADGDRKSTRLNSSHQK